MSALTRFFFRNEVTCRTPAEVIAWWEARRLPFNVAVDRNTTDSPPAHRQRLP